MLLAFGRVLRLDERRLAHHVDSLTKFQLEQGRTTLYIFLALQAGAGEADLGPVLLLLDVVRDVVRGRLRLLLALLELFLFAVLLVFEKVWCG